MGSLVWARAVASSLAVCSLMLPSFVTFCPALSWPKIALKTDPTWAQVGSIFDPKWASGGLLGASWRLLGPPGRSRVAPGPLLGPSWAALGGSWAELGAKLGPAWSQLRPQDGLEEAPGAPFGNHVLL